MILEDTVLIRNLS